MPIAIFALALAAFSIGTTEFIVSGILPAVSGDLEVSIPTAGLLVTGYAAGVAVGGPLLAVLVARLPPKPTIIGLMLVFALGQALCALAGSYELLLAARLVSAAGHGVFFGVASVAVSRLVSADKRGAALSLFVGGITVANILGLPGGTAIGNAYGWRASFACIAVLALLAVLAIAFTLPASGANREAEPPLRAQLAQLRLPEVYLSYLIIAVIMVGQLAFATFQVPILTDVTRIAPSDVPWFLLLGGAGAVAGIWLGGKLADWRLVPSLLGIVAAQVLCFALLLAVAPYPLLMGPSLFIASGAGFAFSTPIQVRILNAASAAPNLASTMISTAYNIGIAAGALLGAILLSAGLAYALLPAVGICCSGLALLIALLSARVGRTAVAAA